MAQKLPLLHALCSCTTFASGFTGCPGEAPPGVLDQLLNPAWQPLLTAHVLPHLSRSEQANLRCTCSRAVLLPITHVTQLSIQPVSMGRSPRVLHRVYPRVDSLELRVSKASLFYFQGVVNESSREVLEGIRQLIVWLGMADTHVSLTQVLSHLPKLERVQLWEATPGALHSLASLAPHLTRLDATMQMDLLAPEVSACFSQLGSLSRLRSLSMGGFAFEEFPDLSSIKHLTALTQLELWGIRCISSRNNMHHLSVLTGLASLRVDVFDVSVDGLAALTALVNLTKLDIQAFWVTNHVPSVTQALDFVPSLPRLSHLSIAAWAARYMLPTLHISLLGRCPALESLSYSGNIPMHGTLLPGYFPRLHTLDCYADLAAHLHSLSGLRSVTWHTLHLADSASGHTSPVPSLACPSGVTSLCVMSSHRSVKPRWCRAMLRVFPLQRVIPPALQSWASGVRSGLPSLAELKAYSQLQALSLNCSSTSDATLALIATHMTQLTSLTLDLLSRDSRRVSDRGVAKLAKCPRLEKLTLRHLRCVTQAGLAPVVANPRLLWLGIEYCPRVSKRDMGRLRALAGNRLGFDLQLKTA